MIELRKALRTAQNFFPGLAETKNGFYHYTRKYLKIAHEADFRIVSLLPRSEQDLFLDVGANRGQSVLSIRCYRRDARIVSFEPNPSIYARMLRHFGDDSRLRIENFALGAAEGSIILYVPVYRGFVYDGNATVQKEIAFRYLSAKTLYFFNPALLRVDQQSCTLKPLDSLGLAPSFVKIDVEGSEYDVIAGGLNTLKRHEPVMMFEREYCPPRLFETLAALGYDFVALEGDRLVQGDRGGLNVIMMTSARLRQCR